MKIKKTKKPNMFKVESSSRKGKFYEVDIQKPFCTCPQYRFRGIKTGTPCKHILAVKAKYGKVKAKQQKGIMEYIGDKEVDAVELLDKFGEEKVDELIKRGELIETKGKIRKV